MNGTLYFGPGEVRKDVQMKPVGESMSELKPLVRRLKMPVVRRETRRRVFYQCDKAGHLKTTGAIWPASGGVEQRASPNGTAHRDASRENKVLEGSDVAKCVVDLWVTAKFGGHPAERREAPTIDSTPG